MRLDERALYVDGFGASTSTVYQFHGCFWHGHPCVKTAGVVNHRHTGKAMEELYRETLEKDTYVSSLGYKRVVIWECQWERKVSDSREIKAFLAVLFQCVYHVQQTPTPSFATTVSNIHSGRSLDWWSVISPFHHICVSSFLRCFPSLKTLRLDASTLVSV